MGSTGPKRRGDEGQGKPSSVPATPQRSRQQAAGPRRGRAVNGVGRSTSGKAAATLTPGGRQMIKRVFDIPSDFAASREVQLLIMEDVIAAGFDEESVFAVRISLEEAIVNAIRHGNRLDSTKRVRVESAISPAKVEISVEDDGVGFDRARVPDPTAAENLCRPSGRGILLIESYMSSVQWEKGGRRMRMIKHAAPESVSA